MPDEEGRAGPGGRAGRLRPVHRRGLLHGQGHRRQVGGVAPQLGGVGGCTAMNGVTSCLLQRVEVLHGDPGGAAELGVVLHRTVPVPHDEVTRRPARLRPMPPPLPSLTPPLLVSGGRSCASTWSRRPSWSPSLSASWPASSSAGPLTTSSGTGQSRSGRGGVCPGRGSNLPCVLRWDMMVFFMCHCLAWFIADYIQLTGVQVRAFILKGRVLSPSS